MESNYNNTTHKLWNEKYRPSNLDGLIIGSDLKEIFSKYIESNNIINLLFHGKAGSGKTTTAKILAKCINCDYIIINTSDERGIDTVRDKIVSFASTASFKPLKIIILDEFDFATPQMQASLRNVIETYSRSTRFILTCNFIEKVIDPIQSRCKLIKLDAPTKRSVAEHLVNILKNENVEYVIKDIVTIVNQYYPDFRKLINSLQNASLTGKLIVTEKSENSSNVDNVIEQLKLKNTDWIEIRKLVLNLDSYDELFRRLYDDIELYSNGNSIESIITIEEFMYHSSFCADKEINIMACILKLIQIKDKKQII